MLQSFSEVMVDRWVLGWSETCSLQGLINEMGVLELPTSRKLACWLTSEADLFLLFLKDSCSLNWNLMIG